jgi:hypothetical protein
MPNPTEFTRLDRCFRNNKISPKTELGGPAVDWIKTRILLKKLEAQLLYDVLPDGEERLVKGSLQSETRQADEASNQESRFALSILEPRLSGRLGTRRIPLLERLTFEPPRN